MCNLASLAILSIILPLQMTAVLSAVSNYPVAPTVDLGYAIYMASVVKAANSSSKYYSFSNIRYAAPPLGLLRFSKPQPPLNNRSAGIQDGSYGNICPQAFPAWLQTALDVNDVHYYDNIGAGQTQSEDCLFLDVVVPTPLFDRPTPATGAPVVIWVYGGGYINGDKTSLTNPIGLLEHAYQSAIFVAFNYRLGAFGFLASATFSNQSGIPNAGLLDQRLAFEWVQQHIHHFGGDPSRVTLIGESAGGGSILLHITSPFSSAPNQNHFSQAVIQSPAIAPLPHAKDQEETFEAFLRYANVTSLRDAREIQSEILMEANAMLVGDAFYGNYVFGPVVDGSYVPAYPGKRLLSGQFRDDLNLMVSYTANEGTLFTDRSITNDSALDAYVQQLFPYLPAESLDHLLNRLYPPANSSFHGYKEVQARLSLLEGEAFISCNAYYLSHALNKRTWAYVFDIEPALHGQDIAYIFFTDATPNVQNGTLAEGMQEYLMQFVGAGNPNNGSTMLPVIPVYGQSRQLLVMENSGFKVREENEERQERCRWWQKTL